jgi:hypothetical protein
VAVDVQYVPELLALVLLVRLLDDPPVQQLLEDEGHRRIREQNVHLEKVRPVERRVRRFEPDSIVWAACWLREKPGYSQGMRRRYGLIDCLCIAAEFYAEIMKMSGFLRRFLNHEKEEN